MDKETECNNDKLVFCFIVLQMPKVSGDQADTYKCYAFNEYGKAVCTVVLNVIEGKIQDLKKI